MQYWPLLSRIDNTVVDINVHCDPIFYKISKKKEKGRLKSILMSRFDMQFLTIGFYKYIHHLEQN